MKNIIGIGCDNENTMTGEHNSVWSRLRDEVPHAMLMGCTCHSAATTASVACSKLPPHVDDLVTRITNYVSGKLLSHDTRYRIADSPLPAARPWALPPRSSLSAGRGRAGGGRCGAGRASYVIFHCN